MNAHTVPMPARGSELWQDEIPTKLRQSMDNFDLKSTAASRSLNELAEKVHIDGYSIDIDSAVIDGNEWVVPGTIFVDLTYDLGSDDPVTLGDAYPIEVRFHLNGNDVNIDSIEADTSSFFE